MHSSHSIGRQFPVGFDPLSSNGVLINAVRALTDIFYSMAREYGIKIILAFTNNWYSRTFMPDKEHSLTASFLGTRFLLNLYHCPSSARLQGL